MKVRARFVGGHADQFAGIDAHKPWRAALTPSLADTAARSIEPR
jgi:hypothetical protein